MSERVFIQRSYDVILTMDEEMAVIRKYAVEHPEVVKIILEHPDGHCPFPGKCNYFPCETLNCNKDCLDNGYPYRWS